MSRANERADDWMVLSSWVGIVVITGWMSLPLLDGWANDPQLAFGLYSFGLWLVSVVIHWRRFPRKWTRILTGMVILGSLLLLLGMIGELRFLIYGALAIFLSMPMRTNVERILALIFSVVWMPGWGWLVSSILEKHEPLISLVLAALGLILSLLLRYKRNEAKIHSNTP